MKCRRCHSEVALGVPVCPHCRAEQDHFIERVLEGEYRLERRIGKGAYGWVYAARALSTNREVAVKVMRAEHATQEDSLVQRFRQEATLIKRLSHPDAVKIYATGETEDGLLWIAMELLEGEPFNLLLKRREKLPAGECIALLRAVFDVLHEAHQKGIIHRDLKPDNLMVLKDGTTKILDFGISKAVELDTLTQTGVAIGTPAYMPKEQWEGSKNVTPAADVYALGIIIYKALSGRFPFEAATPAAWMHRHCMSEPTPLHASLEGCSLALSSAVMKALQKDPAQRYQDTLSFKKALEDALTAEPGDAPALSPADEGAIPIEEIGQQISGSGEVKAAVLPATTQRRLLPKSMRWLWVGLAGIALVAVLLLLSTNEPQEPPKTPTAPLPPALSLPASVEVVASTQSAASTSLPVASQPASQPQSQPQSQPSPEQTLLLQATSLATDKRWEEAAKLAKKAKEPELAKSYEEEAKAQKNAAKCEALKKKKKIDDAMELCSKIEPTTQTYEEHKELIEEVRLAFKKKHYALAKNAIKNEKLSTSRREMKLLAPFKEERDVAALQLKYFALEETCKRRLIRACQ